MNNFLLWIELQLCKREEMDSLGRYKMTCVSIVQEQVKILQYLE